MNFLIFTRSKIIYRCLLYIVLWVKSFDMSQKVFLIHKPTKAEPTPNLLTDTHLSILFLCILSNLFKFVVVVFVNVSKSRLLVDRRLLFVI